MTARHVPRVAVPPPATGPDRFARLPLRAELYLIAHDDDRGTPHIHPHTLAVGLAGAILLELWLARRVWPGWRYDPAHGRWLPCPGHVTVVDPSALGDPLADAALASLRHAGYAVRRHEQLRTWLRQFAATDLYERVRANMVTVGVLRRTNRRRYGLTRTDAYTAADGAWAVRARARIRSVVHVRQQPGTPAQPPDPQCGALCGLVDVLELADCLYAPDLTTTALRRCLRRVADEYDPAIREVLAAVDAGRGDLAVAAMG
jgi:hypothetical protein